MINNINFESNCKRNAKFICKNSCDLDVLTSGVVIIDASKKLFEDFNENRKKYEKEINKEINKKINWGKISNGRQSMDMNNSIVFDIEYNDVDAETEDW